MRLKTNLDIDSQTAAASKSAGLVKMAMGICNNSTFLIMLDANDAAKRMPNYRGAVKHAFRNAFESWKQYENRLKYARENRMFHLADMDPATRKKFGNITDDEFFEFWQGCGYTAYMKSKPFVTSLCNKFRLSLLQHHVKNENEVAWVMTAMAALRTCTSIWKGCIDECVEKIGLRPYIANGLFQQFNVEAIAKAWELALYRLEPNTRYELEPIEERNITLGIEQLASKWADTSLTLSSVLDTIDDYTEVFATMGYASREKKNIKRIMEGI